LNSNELDSLLDGLRQNDLLNYTHLLTGKFIKPFHFAINYLSLYINKLCNKGYVGDASFLNKLADLVEELKEKNPNLIYRKNKFQ
jgi:hypothetical protein